MRGYYDDGADQPSQGCRIGRVLLHPCIASAGVLTRNKSPRVQCCVNQANALVLSVGSNCCRVSSGHTAAPAY